MTSYIYIAFLCSCNRSPKDARILLKASGENRPELEKVIQHYSQYSADSLKLKAAYFLLGNMDNKFTLDCKEILKYDQIFSIPLKRTTQDLPIILLL